MSGRGEAARRFTPPLALGDRQRSDLGFDVIQRDIQPGYGVAWIAGAWLPTLALYLWERGRFSVTVSAATH